MTKAREVSIENKRFRPDEFWSYSVRTYDLDGMKDICLDLQDTHGADVNMLLLCAWLDQQHIMVPDTTLAALHRLSVEWQHSILGPARQKRRATPKTSAAYKKHLQDELLLEKDAQKALLKLINSAADLLAVQPADNARNITAYGALAGIPTTDIQHFIQSLGHTAKGP